MEEKIISCKSCGTQFKNTEKKCPHCGRKSKKSILPVLLIIIGVIVIIGIIFDSDSSDESGASQQVDFYQSVEEFAMMFDRGELEQFDSFREINFSPQSGTKYGVTIERWKQRDGERVVDSTRKMLESAVSYTIEFPSITRDYIEFTLVDLLVNTNVRIYSNGNMEIRTGVFYDSTIQSTGSGKVIREGKLLFIFFQSDGQARNEIIARIN